MAKTPISALQELMTAHCKALPVYRIEEAKIGEYSFMCTALADGMFATGYGKTKQAAKQSSAKELLEKFGHRITHGEVNNNMANNILQAKTTANINYVGKLNEFASQKAKPYPVYSEESILPINGVFIVYCNFISRQSTGRGCNKKTAKQEAAKNMLDMLRNEVIIDETKILSAKKVDNINRLTQEVLERFDQLSFSPKQLATPEPKFEVSKLKKGFNSLDELIDYLQRNGHKCIISIFQRNPYIMAMEIEGTNCSIGLDNNCSINNHCRVMGVGETQEKALEELRKMMELMISHKFSFGVTNKVKSS